MKNIHEVIREREQVLQQIQKELEALHLAARLLAEEGGDGLPRPTIASIPAGSAQTVAPSATTAASVVREPGTYSAAWSNAPKQFP